MTICVLGASGMLGSMLVDYLSKNHQVKATVRDWDKVKLVPGVEYKLFDAMDCRPVDIYEIVNDCNVVINAIGAIPQRTKDIGVMTNLNCNLPRLLDIVGIPTIQIATDCVYSGTRGQYQECEDYDYKDSYGCTKSMGEVKSSILKYLRCSIVGRGHHDDYSLLGWFLSRLQGATISGYVDHKWNGITTLAFAKICEGIVNSKFNLIPQMQHIVPADSISKCDLLRLFRTYFNRTDITIEPTRTIRVDRTLATSQPGINESTWSMAGYQKLPTIEMMIKELAEYWKC